MSANKDDMSAPSTRSDSASSRPHDDLASSNRRRRGVGIVTPNACTECRKKRAKCDGSTPCGRCTANETKCIYEIPVRQSKDTMRSEIEQLQNHRRQAERLVSHLSSRNVNVDETLNRLRNGQSLEMVSAWLQKEGVRSKGISGAVTSYSSPATHDAIHGTLRQSGGLAESVEGSWRSRSKGRSNSGPSSRHQSSEQSQGEDAMNWQPEEEESDRSHELNFPMLGFVNDSGGPEDLERARGRGQNQLLAPVYNMEQRLEDVSVWTSVTDSPALVEHLLALYFCWEYPTFATLSKEHFLTDFRSGQPRYCSALLLNAMLALGCRFSNLPEARVDPDRAETAGDHFYAEAKRLLEEDDFTSLTTIQALGLMSIRECSCGRDTESLYLCGQAIRLCVEFGLHNSCQEQEENIGGMEHEVKSATFWGAFSLDSAWSLAIGRSPHLSRTARFVTKPSIIESIESSEWVPYSDDGTPFHKVASQPSNVRSVFRCFAELSEIVHQCLYTLYTPGPNLTSNEVVSVYFRYLNWYNALPEVLRLGTNFTPAVLFAHMYYHFAILLTLRPFIKVRFIGSGVSPRDVCSQAADAITTLVRSYDNLYTLQRTPSFVPFIVLASSIMHLVVHSDPPEDVAMDANPRQQVLQGAEDLRSMSPCHGFAGRSLDIMKCLALYWNVPDLSEELSSKPTPESKGQRRPSTSQMTFTPSPIDASIPGGNPSNSQSAMNARDTESFKELQRRCISSTKSLNIFHPSLSESMDMGPLSDSILFAPFPLQGTPLIAEEDEMIADGFERLDATPKKRKHKEDKEVEGA